MKHMNWQWGLFPGSYVVWIWPLAGRANFLGEISGLVDKSSTLQKSQGKLVDLVFCGVALIKSRLNSSA